MIIFFGIPIALCFLERRYTQELVNRGLGLVAFQLLGIVVFVLNIDVAALFFVIVFVLKIVPFEWSV